MMEECAGGGLLQSPPPPPPPPPTANFYLRESDNGRDNERDITNMRKLIFQFEKYFEYSSKNHI